MSEGVKIEHDSDGDDFSDPGDFELPSMPAQPLLRPQQSGSSSSSSSQPFGGGALRQPMPAGLTPQQQTMLQSFAESSGMGMGGAGPSMIPSNARAQMIPTPDASQFKHYQAIYPIYIDSSRPHKNGERRVNKTRAIRWPKAQEIAEAASRLPGLKPVFEPEKTHPRDWANPGRVRVLIKEKDGKLCNKQIPDKLTLLNRICEVIKHLRTAQPSEKGITGQLPVFSPAVSFGTLEEAMKGGGKMNEMMKAMMGGGASGSAGAITSAEEEAEIKRRQEEKENAEKQRLAKMKQLQKQGRRVVRR